MNKVYFKLFLSILSLFCIVNTFAQDKIVIVVAQDGSGNYKSIQEAINSLPKVASSPRVILIKKGIYKEKLFIESNFITLKGEDPANTQIIYSEARDIFRCSNKDDWGVATLNLRGSDITLENLSFINNYGFEVAGDVTMPCAADTVNHSKLIRKIGHQMALRSFNTTRLIAKNCVFRALGGDTVSPWNGDDGMFYFYKCTMEGGVDFYCPRGWALAEKCKFICHSMEASIWHDGSKNQSSKTVLIDCSFTGDDGFKLGRYHKDAQFYLLNCSFPKNMADADIYQKEANPANVLQWGKRVFYFDCHREGGDYTWFKNNLPDSVGANDIDPAWTFDYKWNPKKDVMNNSIDDSKIMNGSIDSVAENILLYQRKNGGWPKHFQELAVNYKRQLSEADKKELAAGYIEGIDATIDNDATSKEIKYLVKAYKQTKNKTYLESATAGIDYLLTAQYQNGGWPQFYPDFSSYRSEITYNDNAMINVLNILEDIVEQKNGFDVISKEYIPKSKIAVKKGIDCILKTQINQKGKLTVWCAQYDAKTLAPAMARKFELVSLSGAESVGIVRFLMRFDHPSQEIQLAVSGAVNWFDQVKIVGYKFIQVPAPSEKSGRDRIVVPDENSTIWARFYDIDTNIPFFCGRDSQPKKTLAEIENERRVGYQWYGDWPAKLINEEYSDWAKKWLRQE